MWRRLHRHTPPFGRSAGQSLVEFALILPIFLLLIAGAVDLGRLFYAYVAIASASKEGALFGAAEPQCFSRAQCSDPRNVVFHVQAETGGLTDAAGAKLIPTWACLPPGSSGSAGPPAAARTTTTTCQVGETYEVGLTYDFRLITPILGSLLEGHLMLAAKADATVLNQSYVPIPGLSVTKEVQDKQGDWVRTPTVDPKTGAPKNLEFDGGTRMWYRISVRNTGATTLTGLRLTDDAFTGGWPPTSENCPRPRTSLGAGETYICRYSSDLPTKPQKDRANTVTISATGLSPVVDVAIIDIVASPPRLDVHKQVGVFRHGKDSSWDSDLTVHRGSRVDPTVWYRLTVTNTGGSPATGFNVDDSDGPLRYDSDCPRPPSTLDPFDRWVCYTSETFNRAATFTDSLTVSSKETGDERDDATVHVQTCKGSDLVVPNLVEDDLGTVRTVAEARSAWTDAGFTVALVPASGSDGRDVESQDPSDPFECDSPAIIEQVSHK